MESLHISAYYKKNVREYKKKFELTIYIKRIIVEKIKRCLISDTLILIHNNTYKTCEKE